jgi:GH24 family phage-related lysozyme (muramidase)
MMKKYVLVLILMVSFVVSGGHYVEMGLDPSGSDIRYSDFKTEKELYSQSDYVSVLDMLKGWEGFRSVPYEDLAGGLVTGYGHMIRKEEGYLRDIVLSEDAATRILIKDYNYFIDFAHRATGLEGKQLLALGALLFNTGEHKLTGSGLLSILLSVDDVGLEKEWLRWCHYKKEGEVIRSDHLYQRRQWEVSFYKEQGFEKDSKIQGIAKADEGSCFDTSVRVSLDFPIFVIHRYRNSVHTDFHRYFDNDCIYSNI